jgi:hypothetical protein
MRLERRAYQRVSSNVGVTVSIPGGPALFSGRAHNLSLGGLFVEVGDVVVDRGEIEAVTLVLDLSLSDPPFQLRCLGVVTWNTDEVEDLPAAAIGRRGFGIELIDLGEAQLQALATLLA